MMDHAGMRGRQGVGLSGGMAGGGGMGGGQGLKIGPPVDRPTRNTRTGGGYGIPKY